MLTFVILVLTAGLAGLAWVFLIEPRSFQINHHDVPAAGGTSHTLTILHLTDIHFAKPSAPLSRFFDRLGRETYDLIVLTGDIFDAMSGDINGRDNLKKLKARYGVYAVFGNHDYYDYRKTDIFLHNFRGQSPPRNTQMTERFSAVLKEAGVRVLRNESVAVTAAGFELMVHGLDDPTTRHADVRPLYQAFDPGKINILLTHSIDVIRAFAHHPMHLAFAGHSHGGQVRFPLVGPVVTHTTMGKKFAAGVLDYHGTTCVISRGIGTSRYLPLRLLCPPEAIVIHLKGASGGIR